MLQIKASFTGEDTENSSKLAPPICTHICMVDDAVVYPRVRKRKKESMIFMYVSISILIGQKDKTPTYVPIDRIIELYVFVP